MIAAIIPACGGSKRIPKKNIRLFAGRPIISYSILAAIEAGLFDKIIVSTDSEEIIQVAIDYGAEAPFLRPTELADDFTGTDEVIIHALQWFEQKGINVENVCCIYATAPFLQADYIRKGYEVLHNTGATSVFSVTTYSYPIFRSLKITERERLEMFWPEYNNARSQDLPVAYHDAGQFYWLNVENYLKERKLFSNDSVPIILPRYLVQDIDTLEDWERAELMFKALYL